LREAISVGLFAPHVSFRFASDDFGRTLRYDKETPDEVTVSIYDPDNKLDAPPTLLDLAMKVNLGKKIGKNIGNITSKMFNQNPPPTSGKAAYLV
jgi:hypothetical protein